MVCPYCEQKTRVTNSRAQKRTGGVWRRRQCTACMALFTSEEHIDYSTTWLVQKSSEQTTPFERDVLLLSIAGCVETPQEASQLTDTVLKQLLSLNTALITTSSIKTTCERVLTAYSPKSGLLYMSTQEDSATLRKKLQQLQVN